MRALPALCSALALGVPAASALAAAAPQPPPGVSVAQPAGDVCPPGGRYITDAYAPKPLTLDQTRAPRLKTADSAFKVATIATGLNKPRSMAVLPDGRILLAEGRDHLRLVDKAGKLSAPLAGAPAIAEGRQTGIMDLALDRGFARTGLFYVTYNANKPGAVSPGPDQPIPTEGRLVKARLVGGAVEVRQTLYVGANLRRVVMLGDGTLAFTSISADGKTAQDGADDGGKVLRIRTDGGVPADNPFASRTDVGRFVYTLGHRDPDGLTRDPQGRLWAVEHGPRGGDELNLIGKGRNYGFPTIGYGRDYSGAPLNNDATTAPGLQQPVYYWTPDIAPSGLLVYSGAMFPAWKGDVFIGGLVAESLVRLQMKNGRVAGEEFMLASRCNRVRDVRQGKDGSIYLLTDAADGQLLHITRS